MKDERLRITVHVDYASALGLAVYCFASLEWNAVQCCEAMEPGSVEDLEERTAGRVADTLAHLAKRRPETAGKLALQAAASDFRFLVGTRNNLVHAKPGTARDGSAGLFRLGDHWALAELEGVADAFAACSARLEKALGGLRPGGG
ncbi:MAG TPA: hypothetical protein VGC35_11740 [Allosphingosinicella sp.]